MNPTRRLVVLADKPVTLAALHTIELKLGPNGEPPAEFRVFAKGAFETKKGTFTFDDVAAGHVFAAAKDYGNDFVVDYCHGTLEWMPVDPSLSGKAAGWIPNAGLELREGELWAVGVTWTPDAAGALKNREYRYLSPAFRADENNRIREFINIALTNTPATKRMEPLVLDGRATPGADGAHQETRPMKLIAIALGLAETATEAEILAALHKLSGQHKELVALTGKGTHAEAIGVIEAHKAATARVTELSARVQELEAAKTETELGAEIDKAITEGRATPAQRPMLLAMGKSDPTTLKAYLAASPVINAATPEAKAPATPPATVTAEQLAVEKQLGL